MRYYGFYHVVSSVHLSKYEFGVRIAKCFGYDERLIRPASVAESGLKAARSPNLTLRTDKLTRDLGMPPPDVESGIEKFYQLHESGYAQQLKELIWKSE